MDKKIKFIISLVVSIIGGYIASQPGKNGAWLIDNPANSWSSVCYALPDAPLSIKGPLMTLSIVSFGLWANSTTIINFIDVTCIYWVIIIISLSILPGAKNKLYMIYAIDTVFILYISTAIYLDYSGEIVKYYHLNLVPITGTIMVLNMVTLGSYYARNKVFIVGSGLMVVGFACKLGTIYLGHYWGTSIFHTLTAIGIAVLLPIDSEQQLEHNIMIKTESISNLV
ncbi:MAG: hypothetical protein ACOVRN_18890 [Flavobacterium sp.]